MTRRTFCWQLTNAVTAFVVPSLLGGCGTGGGGGSSSSPPPLSAVGVSSGGSTTAESPPSNTPSIISIGSIPAPNRAPNFIAESVGGVSMRRAFFLSLREIETTQTDHGPLLIRIDQSVAVPQQHGQVHNLYIQFAPGGPLYFYQPGNGPDGSVFDLAILPLDYVLPSQGSVWVYTLPIS